jgi:uncharacterized protein (TIGR02302 family)
MKPSDQTGDRQGEIRAELTNRIRSAVTRARFASTWECAWPRLIWPLGVGLTFVACAWMGLWLALPDVGRIAGLFVFAVLFLVALWPLRSIRIASYSEGLARIEHVSGFRNRPLQTLGDSLPGGVDDVTRALWSAHRARLSASIGELRAGWPAPGVDRADRYGLRVIVVLLLFVGYFAAGDARFDRIRTAFRPFAAGATVEARLDAWVTPPDYTAKPAILLTAEGGPPLETDGTIRVPQGSGLVIRASGLTGRDPTLVNVTDSGSDKPVLLEPKSSEEATAAKPPTSGPARQPSTREFELKLATSGEITVSRAGARLAHWRFAVVPDKAPSIKFVGLPEVQASGSLKLTYEVADEYGVVGAEAHFEAASDSFPVTTNAATVRPLVTPPDFNLSLPAGHAKTGQASSFRDLTSHPWSGGKVLVTLIARNEAGLEGRSETKEIILPTRGFSKPVARAIVEQRRVLALDANRQPQVTDGFDALLIAPEHFYDTSAVFLGMSQIYRDLINARTDDQLRDLLGFMWDVATGIEDGNLSQAEKAVRDAEEALRKALDNGASDKEIAALTAELRKALDNLMRELAEAARKNPSLQRQPSPNQRVMRQQDLNRMLDRIENLAKTGSRDAARQMLSELQRMMENLQQGDAGEQGDQQQSEANEALDKLGEMIQRQQQLMDKTHRLDKNGDQMPPNGRRQAPQQPTTPEERQQALRDLEKNQGDLRQALKELRDKMAQQGLGKKPGKKPGQPGQDGKQPGGDQPGSQPGAGGGQTGDGDDPFGDAGEAMGEAKDALGNGEAGDAVEAQGRALDQLRNGAKQMLDQMAQQQGRGRTGISQGDNPQGDDPLGRPRRNAGPQDNNSVKVPDEIDTQRARAVLEDIRRRLSEPMRPHLELDYLERLLQGE